MRRRKTEEGGSVDEEKKKRMVQKGGRIDEEKKNRSNENV